MKKLSILFFLLSTVVVAVIAQTEKGYTYINKYKNIAMAEMQRSGVPAAITLAQGILESQYGESELCKQSNNHFGIKCKAEWTGDKVYHDDDEKNECFRVYPDAAASFRDHSDFLKNRPYYASLFILSPTDIEGWAYGLKKAGYATEKDYPQRLLKIINDYNLNQYTIAALQQTNKNNSVVADFSTPKNINQKNSDATFVKQSVTPTPLKEEKEEVEIFANYQNGNRNTTSVTNNNYPQGIFSINHSKVIFANAGTSLLAIAYQYHVSLSKLLEFNEMSEINILPKDRLIFLERKLKKGDKDFHVVTKTESLYDICQREGVRMENVLQYNSLKKDAFPAIGEKIYLRYQAPNSPKTIALVTTSQDAYSNNSFE